MTLRCECGGELELLKVLDGDNGNGEGWAYEKYQCVRCGEIGSYSVNWGPWGQNERKRGCIA
ncbi:hypothetical protein AKJ40_00675 [candidate division MSBL1 archaeon SCGC-AAA259M10]|uniref:Uncharacterized protein n=1 Tax=candidate division MSBL1 archaeon SCGC-AAA259M10 TaxID=1698270 RepID=A0A133V2V9_9EURY|nr:hypothetical protein AKJ40_00675 [candidate division MSBL1 archaeon SCGC-AAA259M10]